MTWDSVPWFVGGGATHSPEIARLMAYAATGGAAGIITPGDLKVTPLDIPSTSVRVLAGACLIPAKSAGGAQQTYVGRNPSQDIISVPASGSSAARSHLVVARVEDPYMAGEPYQTPSDRTKGPYIFTRLITDVSPTTTTVPVGNSAIPLARIDVPANTGTITSAMIKDLRQLARPRETRFIDMQAGPSPAQSVTLSNTNWFNWPSNYMPMVIPQWANFMVASFTLNGILAQGSADVNLRVRLTPASGTELTGDITYFDYNSNGNAGAEVVTTIVFAEFDVTALRGVSCQLGTQARRVFTENTGTVMFDAGQQVQIDVTFYERAA